MKRRARVVCLRIDELEPHRLPELREEHERGLPNAFARLERVIPGSGDVNR